MAGREQQSGCPGPLLNKLNALARTPEARRLAQLAADAYTAAVADLQRCGVHSVEFDSALAVSAAGALLGQNTRFADTQQTHSD